MSLRTSNTDDKTNEIVHLVLSALTIEQNRLLPLLAHVGFREGGGK